MLLAGREEGPSKVREPLLFTNW